jgi:hypothetical protein
LGPSFTVLADPFALLSDGGTVTATVANPGAGGLERRNQGSGWAGNFAPGDELVWTQNEAGPLDITFSGGVFGAGAQIQRDAFGAFTATIDVYDTFGVFLVSYSLAGLSSSAGDNSAIFLGVLDTSASIGRIVYSVDMGTQDFAINQLDIVNAAVPEPGTLVLVGAGLLGLAINARRRRLS